MRLERTAQTKQLWSPRRPITDSAMRVPALVPAIESLGRNLFDAFRSELDEARERGKGLTTEAIMKTVKSASAGKPDKLKEKGKSKVRVVIQDLSPRQIRALSHSKAMDKKVYKNFRCPLWSPRHRSLTLQ